MHLVNLQRVRRSGESGTSPDERLGAGPRAQQELRVAGEALAVGQVGDEVGDVAAEARARRPGILRHEAVHLHLPVEAVVQVPGGAGDGGRRDRAARRRDGARSSQGPQPDHHLVLGVARGRGRREEVVGYVRYDGGAGVAGGGRWVSWSFSFFSIPLRSVLFPSTSPLFLL